MIFAGTTRTVHTIIPSSLATQWRVDPTRFMQPVVEFKEFERRFKFNSRLKYGWFHLKLYQMFQDLSRVLADLNRGSNSLNSISGKKNTKETTKGLVN